MYQAFGSSAGDVPDDPLTYDQAMASDLKREWHNAIQIELNSLKQCEAYVLVKRPVNKPVVGCRWVFKTKLDPEGDFTCYRARLVAEGFSQSFGIDCNETFAPVVGHSSLRLLFAISAVKKLKIHHLDVNTAFLNGDLREEIFLELPEGFNDGSSQNCVLLLKKAVYGLRQSARVWNEKAHEILLELGFVQPNPKVKPCIYSRINCDMIMYSFVYG